MRLAPVALAALASAPAVLHAGPADAAPRVTVSPRTTGLDPAGQTLTVEGAGFSRDANGGVGIYVVFGPKGDDYSTNADRYQAAKWVRSSSLGGSGEGELRADGTFRVTLTGLTARYEDGNGELVDCYRVECLVMTFTAHGVPDRGNDTFTPVTFATGKPAPVGTAVVPYRPSGSPAPTSTPRAPATAGAASASPTPVASGAPSAAPSATPGNVPAAAPSAAPSATEALAEPVRVPAGGSGAAPLAGVVLLGAGAGAAATYGLRRARSAR